MDVVVHYEQFRIDNMDVKIHFEGRAVISQSVEYALRAMVLLVDRAPVPLTTAEIAGATRIPREYLRKVLQSLARGGIIGLTRGARGGVALAVPPEKLTILDVVNAVDPIQRIRKCPLGLKAHGVRLCPLHKRLDHAMASVEEAFRQTTLAEILAEPTKSRPLCELPIVK